MGFQKKYNMSKDDNYLIATVLVKCNNCGNSDILSKPDKIEFVAGSYNSTDTSDHEECEICGSSNQWVEKSEHISLSIPLSKNSINSKFETLNNIIESSTIFAEKLKLAKHNNFVIKNILDDKGLIILWKSK